MISLYKLHEKLTIIKSRYFIAAFFVLLLVMLHTINGFHVGDFWEHNAVIKELSHSLSSPMHPQLNIEQPHAFYNPYSVLLALLVRLTGFNSIIVLKAVGILNLIFLFTALKLFIGALTERKQTPFFSLIFILLLWGDIPWSFSGFFHLTNLKYIASYPSTFAAAALFLLLWILIKILQKPKTDLYMIFAILLNLILLIHPITFLTAITSAVIIVAAKWETSRKQIPVIILISIASIMAAEFWPYYSFFNFLFYESSVYNPNNLIMYQEQLKRLFPLILVVPLISLRIVNNRKDPLSLIVISLLLIYLFGWITGNWSYGRVVSFIAVFAQIIIGDFAAEKEEQFLSKKGMLPFRRIAFFILAGLIILPLAYGPLINSVSNIFKDRSADYNKYSFLSRYASMNDVILSDLETSWFIPSFGGKVVAAKNPVAFIPDQELRKKDVRIFFALNTSREQRESILIKYKVNYILINKNYSHNGINYNNVGGTKIYEDMEFLLLKLNNSPIIGAK